MEVLLKMSSCMSLIRSRSNGFGAAGSISGLRELLLATAARFGGSKRSYLSTRPVLKFSGSELMARFPAAELASEDDEALLLLCDPAEETSDEIEAVRFLRLEDNGEEGAEDVDTGDILPLEDGDSFAPAMLRWFPEAELLILDLTPLMADLLLCWRPLPPSRTDLTALLTAGLVCGNRELKRGRSYQIQ